jgi:hypothetical protein
MMHRMAKTRKATVKKKASRIRLAYVRWFDSGITDYQACSPKEAAGILENESAGVLVAEDKKSITIALDRCLDTESLRCTLCIPKVNVRSIRRFQA